MLGDVVPVPGVRRHGQLRRCHPRRRLSLGRGSNVPRPGIIIIAERADCGEKIDGIDDERRAFDLLLQRIGDDVGVVRITLPRRVDGKGGHVAGRGKEYGCKPQRRVNE